MNDIHLNFHVFSDQNYRIHELVVVIDDFTIVPLINMRVDIGLLGFK